MTPLDELAQLLRPAGGGIHTVSTGRAEQAALQRRLYAAAGDAEVTERWRGALASIASAEVAILAIPSDCGAGLVRGAAWGPTGLRQALLSLRPGFPEACRQAHVVDVGDVCVVPHLLDDTMASAQQLDASRRALYPDLAAAEVARLPVSPLSIAGRACDLLLGLNPRLRLLVLGGDHSIAWPVVASLARHVREPWAIVQPDAHTDLLPERLGVKICFATWAYHANELLGRGGRLVQVGIRASGKPREHWERTLGVRQFWAAEVAARGDAGTLDDVVAHLRSVGAKRVYFSNDIDGTDAALAPATGAPEPDGLAPALVEALVDRVAAEFPLLGADLCEVAPPVGSADGSRRTCEVGARYLLRKLAAMAPGFATMIAAVALLLGGAGCRGGCDNQKPAPPAAAKAPLPTPVKSSLFRKNETAIPTPLGQGAVLVVRYLKADGAPAKDKVVIMQATSLDHDHVVLEPDARGRIEAAVSPGRYLVGSSDNPEDSRAVDVYDRQEVLVVQGKGPDVARTVPAPVAAFDLEVTLSGPDGKPAGGAWAWLWVNPEKKDQLHREARADARGVVRFADVPPGATFFGAEHPTDGILDGQEIARAKEGPTGAAFKLNSAGSIQGRIVDPSGGPLADVPVSISGPLVVCPRGPLMEATRWQITDAGGGFRFHGLRRGRYRVEAGWRAAMPDRRYSFPKRIHPPLEGLGTPPRPPPSKRHADDVYELSTMPGQHVGGLTFVEDPSGTVSGSVMGADGNPARARIEIFFAARTGGGTPPAEQPVAVTAAGDDGRFKLTGLLRGRAYRLRATGPGGSGEAAEVRPDAPATKIVVK